MNTYRHFRQDIKRFCDQIARWQTKGNQAADEGDMNMARQYEQDVKDLTDILNCIERGDFETAFDLAYECDTILRERIPARIYNFIAKENGYC